MTDEIQKHLDKGRYGTPLLKPDEQRKYLGTFRERCQLSMTIEQMKNEANKKQLISALEKFPDSSILINGSLPESLQTSYIQVAMNAKLPFTVVNQEIPYDKNNVGLLVVAKKAVNEETIDIEKKFVRPSDQPSDTQEKNGFWPNLFH